jgi:hypothetical protein
MLVLSRLRSHSPPMPSVADIFFSMMVRGAREHHL